MVKNYIYVCQVCGQPKGKSEKLRCLSCAAKERAVPTGTEIVLNTGYVFIKSQSGRWVRKHREVTGVTAGEHVHHVNGEKSDNRAENLVRLSPEEHRRVHREKGVSEETKEKCRAYALSPEGNEVKRRAGRLGGGSNRKETTVAEVVSLRDTGLTLAKIASKLEVSVKVVRNRLREAAGLKAYGAS